jgi:hypothetical protein
MRGNVGIAELRGEEILVAGNGDGVEVVTSGSGGEFWWRWWRWGERRTGEVRLGSQFKNYLAGVMEAANSSTA